MLSSIAQAAGFVALLSPLSLAAALPAEVLEQRTPEVPWKQSGINEVYRRGGYPSGCMNGPSSRNCWDGTYSVDTDFDLDWPDTGKTVTVCRYLGSRNATFANTTLVQPGNCTSIIRP